MLDGILQLNRRCGVVLRSKLGGIPNCGHFELGALELGAQSGRKNQPACYLYIFLPNQVTLRKEKLKRALVEK